MKAVLMSIQPEWCEKIASGKKTVEVRKSKPKLATPFKVFIYCTNGGRLLYKSGYNNQIHLWQIKEHETTRGELEEHGHHVFNGKVIGEFVCDFITNLSIKYSNPDCKEAHKIFPFTGLTDKQIMDYLGNGKDGYGWHISDLVIYDKPMELSEFFREGDCDCGFSNKKSCPYYENGNSVIGVEGDCTAPFDTTTHVPILRPPQSWCYVAD